VAIVAEHYIRKGMMVTIPQITFLPEHMIGTPDGGDLTVTKDDGLVLHFEVKRHPEWSFADMCEWPMVVIDRADVYDGKAIKPDGYFIIGKDVDKCLVFLPHRDGKELRTTHIKDKNTGEMVLVCAVPKGVCKVKKL
jgi:hypothetical protein